ncbi:DUF1801 domain-containing protein [Pseudorhodobacter antarcticus]
MQRENETPRAIRNRAMITDIDSYFTKGCRRCARFDTLACSALRWRPGNAALRAICLSAGLEEALKWGHPGYTHAGRNITVIGAFVADYRLTFMDASLLSDPAGILEKAEPNSQHANILRFTDVSAVAAMAPHITAYLTEAMRYAKAGITPTTTPRVLDLPQVLIDALDADPDLSIAFAALTPGRQAATSSPLRPPKSWKPSLPASLNTAPHPCGQGRGGALTPQRRVAARASAGVRVQPHIR